MLASVILITAIFLIQYITILESVSTSKRIVYQTFFDNLYLTCYGTCTPSANGLTSVTKSVRCEGNKVRLKCAAEHVIRVSFAFYGELEPGQELCKDVSSVLEQCRKDVSNLVSKDCDGKELCLFTIDDRRFGQFCQAKYFYLDVRHLCEFRPSTMENTNFPTTTRRAVTTRVKTTTEKSTKIRPITIYKEESTDRTKVNTKDFEGETTNPIYTTKDRRTEGRETKSSETSSSTSQSSSSGSSSSPVTTHVPMSSPGTSTKGTTPRKNIPAPNINTSVATSSGRGSSKKASMYWLLTAHSLVTDKSFIKANSTHLVLAIILSIFIALVLSVCFTLDHCRREKRKIALIKSREADGSATEESRLENGSPPHFDLRRGPARQKSRSQCNSAIGNGSAKYSVRHSLDEINHNSEERDDRMPLIPLPGVSLPNASLDDFNETAFMARSSTIDLLPPPPAELLADSPQLDKGRYLDDDDSDTSTVSIPPPVGFGDSDIDVSVVKPLNVQPELKVTSPTPTNSSISSSHLSFSNSGARSVPKIDNSKRLNNEYCSEIPLIPYDSNLLQNSVSVQTNDLRDGYDRQTKVENPGQVSMKSPHHEVSDIYATTDTVSNVGFINLHDLSTHDSYDEKAKLEGNMRVENRPCLKTSTQNGTGDSCKSTTRRNETPQSAKRGRLLVIKSPNGGDSSFDQKLERRHDISDAKSGNSRTGSREAKQFEQILIESASRPLLQDSSLAAFPDIPNGTLKRGHSKGSKGAIVGRRSIDSNIDAKSDARSDAKSETSSCASNVDSESLAVLPQYDSVSKQIFAVPKHRCGMGHKHPCVCIPLRTGTSSFICSCLENAKQKSSKCCMENCQDESNGMPYSSQWRQNGRGLSTDILKRKNYNSNVKRSSSLENVSTARKSEKSGSSMQSGKRIEGKGGSEGLNGNSSARRESEEVRSKTLPILQSKLKRKPNKEGVKTLDRKLVTGKEPKLIPVIVHSSGTTRSKLKPRFELNTERIDANHGASKSGFVRAPRSEDSDSSDRSDSVDGHLSKSLPASPTGKRRNKNGRLSPICENTSRRPVVNNSDNKSWPKRSPRFRIQVVESIHYDKRQRANEV